MKDITAANEEINTLKKKLSKQIWDSKDSLSKLQTCEVEKNDLKLKLEHCSGEKIRAVGHDTKLAGEVSSLKDLQLSLEAEIRTLKSKQGSKVNDLTNQLGDCHKDVTSLTTQINNFKVKIQTAESALSTEIAKGR